MRGGLWLGSLFETAWAFSLVGPLTLLSEALRRRNQVGEPEVSDERWVERARRGEPGAVEAIYERHAAAVYRRLTHLIGADPEREDLMQEVFVDFFRQLRDFRGAASLRTYLLRIVSHKACDHLRSRQRRRRAMTEAQGFSGRAEDEEPFSRPFSQPILEVSSGAPSPEDRVRCAQELAVIERALDQLTPKKRVAFILRVVDELSLKELAEQVGATVFTVAQRVRHADRELRRLIEERKPSS
jgi:RNA polymerase sigma-70 factor (ECF subfamily)